jgi:acyl carrier protein
MADRAEVMDKVKDCLVDALGVDAEEVVEGATLTDDLGAESIDFLDIVFRLEKTFGIKIPRGDLFPDNLLSSPEYVQDGRLTENGMAMLKEKLPYADFSRLKDQNVADLPNLFTVGMIVNYVTDKVAG